MVAQIQKNLESNCILRFLQRFRQGNFRIRPLGAPFVGSQLHRLDVG